MAAAVREFMGTYPAIRLQHRPDYPVGKGLEAWQDPEGATHLKALIVDDQAKRMVRKGVLAAWSVGLTDVQTQKSARCPRFEIVGFRLTEVSLVDSPSNARCGIQVVSKSAAGSPRYIGKAFVVGDGHRSVLPACFCKACMDGRKRCGCPECSGTVKTLKKAAKLAVDPAKAAEKALRSHLRDALESSDPWTREAARAVLGGQD